MATAAGADTLPAVHDTGDGPALLMLHGFPLDGSQWDHQVAELSDSYRCLRPDLWGCGASPPPPPGEPSLDAYARAVVAALDARGVDRFAVMGLSMGGYVGFALWRAAPSRITALIAVSTRAGADDDARRREREAQAQALLRESTAESLAQSYGRLLVAEENEDEVHVTDPLRGRVRRCTPEGLAYALRAMAARPDSTPELANIAVPTLVVVGGDDRLIPAEEGRAMARAIPHAQLLEMAGCGHVPNLENAPRFNAAVREFLAAAG